MLPSLFNNFWYIALQYIFHLANAVIFITFCCYFVHVNTVILLNISKQIISFVSLSVCNCVCIFLHLSAKKLSEDWSVSGPGTRQWQRPHPVSLSRDDTSGSSTPLCLSPSLFHEGCSIWPALIYHLDILFPSSILGFSYSIKPVPSWRKITCIFLPSDWIKLSSFTS